jgi:hypothetical protein
VRRRGLLAVVALGALGALATLGGCKPPPTSPVELGGGPRGYRAKDYAHVLRRWTREMRITHDYDLALDVYGTFKAWDFRAAWVAKYVEAYKITGRERDALSDRESSEAHQTHDVFISAAASKYEWTDFDRPHSVWRVTLIDDQSREVSPLSITKVHAPQIELQTFFPYIKLFSEQFLVKFPTKTPDGADILTADTRFFILRFAGPLGTAELRWDIGKPI